MQAPVDYPIADAAHEAQFSVDELIYAVYLDRESSTSADVEENILDQRIVLDLPYHCPQVRKPTPKSFADLTQSLLAGEASRGWKGSVGVLARFARTSR